MGKGKDPHAEAEEHVSRPLHTLKDPSAFGPPPKHINYHGGAALPNQITPDTGGWGAPIPQSEIQAKQEAEEAEARRLEEEAAKPAPPPIPYRADRTGLATNNLPPPPKRKDGADSRSTPPAPAGVKPKPPGLPPRLPPRQNSNPSPYAPLPPPTYGTAIAEADPHKGILNQGAIDRLGAAGVSVPGFGIGGKPKPVLPPARSTTADTSSSPPQPPRTNSSQIDELQSRFSRLTSSSSPKPQAPSEGTTFAQKQAALKTASSFRNNPSSISLSDARSTASTANNFRERHGGQAKSGWAAANKFNTKYSITDKVGAFGGMEAQPRDGSPTKSIDRKEAASPVSNGVSVLGKKKPPPPPKKKILAPPSADEGAPPPIPLATKPKPSTAHSTPPPSNLQSYLPHDLPLDLPSLWFTHSPITFPPPSINRLPGTRSSSHSSSWSSNGVRKTHTFTGIVRDNTTLATTKIRLTWDSNNPALTVKAQQQHIPPPRALSPAELENCKILYGEAVAEWCEAHMGRQVGNGECWTLANDALHHIAEQFTQSGKEPCMTSQSYVHGYKIFEFKDGKAEPRGGVLEAGVARGDVVQFFESHFKDARGGQKWAGAPDHTSVVTGVTPTGIIKVVEQNVGGVKNVMKGEYNMAELVKGEVRIFRPVEESWVGKLDPTW